MNEKQIIQKLEAIEKTNMNRFDTLTALLETIIKNQHTLGEEIKKTQK